MFGVGVQEIVIVGLLFLVIFSPTKVPSMVRDLGRFLDEARSYAHDFKSELTSHEEPDGKERQPKP